MNYVNGQLQPAPLQPQAEQMAQYGRYGDSMMVHMNPAEVQGIASLTPGGLTTNPVTGQPEAFAFLIPMLASMAAPGAFTAAAGALGGGALGTALGAIGANSALAGAIGSGLATTAMTGDLKKGVTSGLMGYGLGSALGAGKDAVGGVTEATANLADANTALASATETATAEAVKAGTALPTTATNDALMQLSERAGQATVDLAQTAPASVKDTLLSGEGLKATAKGLTRSGAILPIAVGSGMQGDIEMQEAYKRMGRESERERQAESDRAYNLLGTSLSQVGQDYNMDVSGANRRYAAYDGYNMGGIVSVNPQEYQRQIGEVQRLGQVPVRMDRGGPTGGFNQGYVPPSVRFGPGSAASRQSGIRGSVTKSAEELAEVGYRPGFGPEISYFRERIPEETTTGSGDAGGAIGSGDPMAGANALLNSQMSDVDLAELGLEIGSEAGGGGGSAAMIEYIRQLRAGGQGAGSMPNMDGDSRALSTISDNSKAPSRVDQLRGLDFDYTGSYIGMQEGGTVPSADPLIEQTMMAVLGKLSEDEAEIIINRFLDEYGSEAFQMLREQVLQSVQPNSQTEGVIRGEGRGMDDMVPGTIGAQQPVAVSPGEYIIPADVVSAAGDGDTDAGAQRFDQMLDEVRMQKTGTTKQPDPLVSKAGGLIPA